MELYFFRHGQAEPGGEEGDAARRLTARGREETRRVAEALQRAEVRPDVVISSPLLRARQTAAILLDVFALPSVERADLEPDTRLEDVQRLLEQSPAERIVLVGHAPSLGLVAGELIGGSGLDLSASGVARVDLLRLEPGTGQLVWLLSPELFRP